jgi:tetratricopeptide repeat protein 30
VSSSPKSRAALSLLAFCYYHCQEYGQAVGLYSRLVDLFPSVQEYQIYRIHSLLKIGAVSEAAECLSQAHKGECSQRLLLIRAAVMMENEELDACKGILDECVRDDPETICAEATLDFKEGRYDDALAKYSDAFNLIGFDANLAHNIALCHYMLNQYSDANDIADQIIERGLEQYPEFKPDSVSNDDSFVDNSLSLQESFLVEAYNLKAAIQYNENRHRDAKDILDSLPSRKEEELDPVSLHNNALLNVDQDANASFEKLTFLLSNPPFPPVTFKNILTLYCKYGYQDVAADILAENSELTFDLLSQDTYDFLDASIMQLGSPYEAMNRFNALGKKLLSSIQSLSKALGDATKSDDRDEIEIIESAIEREMDVFIPVIMAQASIYWEREDYSMVEQFLHRQHELCCNNDQWNLNMGHCLFAQQGSKFDECIRYYELYVDMHGDESLLRVSPIVLANLCVAYIMNNQNEEGEELMKRVDKEELSQSNKKSSIDSKHHGCIINLVIGTLYCEKSNYEFGISRICKSLRPFDTKLSPDTWYFAKRCFMALADKVAKQMVLLKRNLSDTLLEFLNDVIIDERGATASLQNESGGLDGKPNTISLEALKLRTVFEQII